jgi:hypothetical protein
MVMGDLFPLDEGDNVADLNDYAVLVNCFNQRRGTPTCPNPRDADINDDGKVDGLDYNVMVLSYGILQDQGITIPKLVIPPTGANVSRLSYLTPKVTKSPATPTPTLVPDKPKQQSGGGLGGLLVFVLFLGILGGGGFFLYLKNPQVKALINGIIHRSPGAKPAAPPAQSPAPDGAGQSPAPQDQAAPVAQDQTVASTQTPPPIAQTPPEPAAPAAQPNETPAQPAPAPIVPVEQQEASTQPEPAPASPPAATASPVAPAAEPAAPAPAGSDAKEYFVKKQSDDETKTGFWLTLTDDNGPQLAHYKGTEVKDGFANIKGAMKTESGKTFLEITELVPEQ